MSAEVQSSQSQLESANSLFKKGTFAESEKIYSKVLTKDPKNFHSTLRLGYIALLANCLDDAQKWLTKAIELKPKELAPKSLLAEVFYRHDNFQQVVPLLRAIGREAMAKKLESFKDVSPYQIEGKAKITYLKFLMTDPLPVVQVRANDSEPVNFFIDTGGAEVVIDMEFAQETGATQFGSEMGTFAGGQQTGYQHGRVGSLTTGDFTLKNVPIHIMDVRRFSPVFGGTRVDGVIGTVLLYHFIATLDYPEGQLTLRLKTEQNLKQIEQEVVKQGSIVVPFWMAGDHYMVTWGTVNNSQPMLFFVDTGLAGNGFTCPESTLQKAGIKLQENQAEEGLGGGGKVRSIPFVVKELTLGNAKEYSVHGVYMGAFPLENAFGFRIGGLISHGFFRHYALSLDFERMRYFLKRKE
jgi:predicted aspartyl protease